MNFKERTRNLALRIIRLYTKLPKNEVARVIGIQLLRSGTSIGANYCEAYRSRSKAEFIAKLGLCVQELDETYYWIQLLLDADILPTKKLEPLISEIDELIAIFTAISKKQKLGKADS